MLARRRRTNSGSDNSPSSSSSSYASQGAPPPPSSHSPAPQQGARYLRTSPPPPAVPPPPDPNMTCRDRSSEFMSAVKLLQSRQSNGVMHRPQSRALIQRSEFSGIAKHIGRDLANTYTKLEKLTLLAQRKSLFDDKPVEIQELTYIIKQDIKSLNEKIAQLQNVSKSQRSQNGRRQHLQTHSNSVVVALQSKLATMSNDFKHVLEVRTENLKQQRNRREQFSQSAVSATSSLPPTALQGHHTGSVLLHDEVNHAGGGGEVAINMDSGQHHPYSNHYQQQQIVQEQDGYLQERADTMQSIESTIVELGSIFTQLAHMVKEQEEMVERIDSNVDDATVNIESAHSEILKYFQSVSSNRWLMIKIFAVLIIFFIVFVVFMA